MIDLCLNLLADRQDLDEQQAFELMEQMMQGQLSSVQIASVLSFLRSKGESVSEIVGFARAMRKALIALRLPEDRLFVDTCGTGGDKSSTINVSSLAAIVAAASGLGVAKHGNRSVSSQCGSADVLKELGVRIDMDPSDVQKCLDEIGLGFIFAQNFHPAMKHVMPVRKELALRTVFNILGPLANPAGVKRQVIGVYSPRLLRPLCEVLKRLGSEKVMLVHSADGLDEVSLAESTAICELNEDGHILEYQVTPEMLGLPRASLEDLKGGDATSNADIARRILSGEHGPKRDIVLANAACALYVGGKVDDLKQGVLCAAELIDQKTALEKLEQLCRF